MTDEKPPAPAPDAGHAERVNEAFDALHSDLGDRVGEEAREELEKIREAAARKDAGEVRDRLEAVRESHGWLYSELVKHPKVASLIDELALWGF